jgi:hypothetical protein
VNYNPIIHEAIFYYEACSEKEGHLKVCISTPEMDAAAWKYAHGSQIILDGTFGVCSSRLLLFIAIDEEGKGVPLAFFLFSAPSGNRATHAGYNWEILRELLGKWKAHLSKGCSCIFTPLIAITDTDTKERGALQDIRGNIWLLLCRYYIRSCWTNRRKVLKLTGANDSDFWMTYTHGRLLDLEVRYVYLSHAHVHANSYPPRLLESVDHAMSMIDTEHINISALGGHPAVAAALEYLDYMTSTWMPEPLWQSWSQKGRVVAAMILDRHIEGVLHTTNHLESFNGLLKWKYIPQWQRSGSRLRFDFLIHTLITMILPEIFKLHKSQQQYGQWLSLRFSKHAGGIDLQQLKRETKSRQLKEVPQSNKEWLCWWEPDEAQDRDAAAIVELCRLIDMRSLEGG